MKPMILSRLQLGESDMNKKLMHFLVAICVMAIGVVDLAVAQNKRTGTAAATELLIPVGARDLAMGGASISSAKGVEAIHWNPAGLGRLSSSAEGMFSSMNYIADIGVNYGAVAATFGEFGTLGLSVKALNFGDIPLTTEDDPENVSARFFSPSFVTVGLSFARGLTDAISVGGTVKFISEQIDRVNGSGFALDFGVQYRGLVGVKGLNMGLAVKNVGPQLKFDGPGLLRAAVANDGRRPTQRYKSEAASFELPSLIEIGLGYEASMGENMAWSVASSFTNNNLYLDEYRVGGEFSLGLESIRLFGRAGMAMVPAAEGDSNIFGPTFGAGIFYSATGIDITLDFAYRQVEFFDANSIVSLKLGF
jgi:hypothetical protein